MDEIIVTMQLPLSPSMNTYWRNFRGRTVLSQAGRDYKLAVQEYVVMHNIPKLGSARLQIMITVHPRDKRKIDLDNRLKAIFDALQQAGVYDDDEQFDLIEVSRGSIIQGGRLNIVLSTINH